MLQTRNGKRTGFAAVNIAVDMVNEKLISKEEAIKRIPAEDLSHLLAPVFNASSEKKARVIGSGLPAVWCRTQFPAAKCTTLFRKSLRGRRVANLGANWPVDAA